MLEIASLARLITLVITFPVRVQLARSSIPPPAVPRMAAVGALPPVSVNRLELASPVPFSVLLTAPQLDVIIAMLTAHARTFQQRAQIVPTMDWVIALPPLMEIARGV